MGDIRYIISDASKKIDVEPHALRYWEEELGLDIPRNEMGHRYYREEDVKILKNVKMLKEQGFQLKAIKMILPNIHKIDNLDAKSMLLLRNELNERVFELESKQEGKGTQVMEPMDSELQSGNEEVEKQVVAEKENDSSRMIEDNERKVEPFMKKAASDNNLIHLDDVRGEHAALSCQEGRTSIDKVDENETVSMQ
ncbi:MAG TPA: MerR family transcriptional regulator, partial [Lachnospiraceae bacterium]|nr:MerR family transcriptional regulator [Lachnospiraceae bacterium]